MFRRLILAAVYLIAVQSVRSQVSTVSVFPIVGPPGATLEGEILGTGTDVTTFVLSASPTDGSGPVTLTLIEDASHVSEVAVEATGSVSAEFLVECGFDSASIGLCTLDERLFIGANITTILSTRTGTVTLTPVLVSASGSMPTATSPSFGQSQSQSQSPSQSATSTSASATPSTPTSAAIKLTTGVIEFIFLLSLAIMMSI